MQTGNIDFIYKNKLDKACFQHDMAYGKSKDLAKITESDKVLKDKTFKIASDTKYDGYQKGLASMVYNFFDKKSSSGSGAATEPNYQLANEFYNNLFKRFWKINNIVIYSTYNEEKAVVAERFIRTLKNKLFQHMIAVSKNVYFDVLDDIANNYKTTVYRSIKMKPIDLASDSYDKHNEDLMKEIPNLKLVIMAEFQNTRTFLLQDTLQIGQNKLLLLVKLKRQLH